MAELTAILAAGSFLVESPRSSAVSDLKTVLLSRLDQYYKHVGHQARGLELSSLEELELETAREAINVVERAQAILNRPYSDTDAKSSEASPSSTEFLLGTRDLTVLRTLISIAFKWGIDPLLRHVISAWPSKPTSVLRARPRIIDMATTPESYMLLSSIVNRLMNMLFPGGITTPLPQTVITNALLNSHLADLLRPCIALGWLPKGLASESMPTADGVRPLVMRLLNTLPPSHTIIALGSILSGAPLPPQHVHKTCTSLLSRQLLRPEGVRGLFVAVFGEDDDSGGEADFEKLDHVSRILSTVPAGMKYEEYFDIIVSRVLALLTSESPSHRRAAAFAISRMLSTDRSFPHSTYIEAILFPVLHEPFLQITCAPVGLATPASPLSSHKHVSMAPAAALSTLITLSTNMDPSPTLISSLLSPIVSALYSLLGHMDHVKTSDPVLKESLRSLLGTWGRASGSQECIEALWDVINGGGGEWEICVHGEIKRIEISDPLGTMSLLTPEDLRLSDEDNFDSNLLNLRPDPIRFVRFLKTIDRPEVSSELFVRVLEAYRSLKSQEENNPMQTLLLLQLVIQMQSQLSDSNSSSNILRKPEHILTFVKHVLESSNVTPKRNTPRSDTTVQGRLRMEDLRIVDEDDSLSDQGDSDDENPANILSSDDEMVETAINLILSILEANEDMSARTTPVLNDIFSLLEPLMNNSSNVISTLAREAKLVMSARLASSSAPWSSESSTASGNEEDPQEVYQRALKLLQDPILPVRAHGLLLLRQLVSSRGTSPVNKSHVDPALVPAIISIFTQAIQDDDSYMFLNAVQGLAAMVDAFGKEVLKNLVNIYVNGLDGIAPMNITQSEVDMRIRVGEALGQVIRRYGAALAIYVDILIPPLFNVVRSPHVPTILRTSALSLLGECENTYSLSLLPYVNDLFEAMVDLLQVEGVAITPGGARTNDARCEDGGKEQTKETITTSSSIDSKFPSLRRAALHFLLLVIRATTVRLYDSGGTGEVTHVMSTTRARAALIYTSSTDEDIVVRVMAREVLEALEQMQQATTWVWSNRM